MSEGCQAVSEDEADEKNAASRRPWGSWSIISSPALPHPSQLDGDDEESHERHREHCRERFGECSA
jgi:hypothetical protein